MHACTCRCDVETVETVGAYFEPIGEDCVTMCDVLYSCILCNDEFASEQKLEEHVKGHITVGTRCYQCDDCNLVFDSALLLLKHKMLHQVNGVPRLFCEMCGRIFWGCCPLSKHLQRQHKVAECY